MSDELEELRAALDRAGPAPDPQVKAAHLAAAEAAFAAHFSASRQETAAGPRPDPESRARGAAVRKGLRAMLDSLNTRRFGLAASTALVAVGLVAFMPQTRSLLIPGPQPGLPGAGPALTADSGTAGGTDLAQVPDRETAAPGPDAKAAARTAEAAPPEAAADALAEAPPPPPQALAEARTGAGAAPPMAAPVPAPGGAFAPAPGDWLAPPAAGEEAFANADPNPVKITAEEPVSTFSLDVDTASWAVVRSSLTAGTLPPPEAVRVEEMLNYFPYAYPAPADGAPFRATVTVMPTPWNPGTRLLQIGLQGAMPAVADRPPLNLVFLIDTSGSMGEADKLPLLIQSFRLLLDQLRPADQVAIVTYAGTAGVALEPVAASDRGRILTALEGLRAEGSTAGAEGLQRAYALARGMAGEDEVSRVLLATDGDFNVGVADPEGLKALIRQERDSGIYLSVLGFGRGNLDDATMQALAQTGNGRAAYIDTLSEARKVLVDELTGALFPIADDVKLQVEFNPATVAEYRLIGYETRALRREDFNNDRVDAGEIGAGVQMTALYELTPTGSPALLNDPLRYGAAAPAAEAQAADEFGFLRLRYKAPGEGVSHLIETPIPVEAGPGGADQRFAAAIAGFGQLLRGSDYLGDWGYPQAIALATGARGDDPFGYRAEALQLMRLAESLSRH